MGKHNKYPLRVITVTLQWSRQIGSIVSVMRETIECKPSDFDMVMINRIKGMQGWSFKIAS